MIKEYMLSMGSAAATLATLSLLCFFITFSVILWRTFRLTPEEVDNMSQIPFDNEKNFGGE